MALGSREEAEPEQVEEGERGEACAGNSFGSTSLHGTAAPTVAKSSETTASATVGRPAAARRSRTTREAASWARVAVARSSTRRAEDRRSTGRGRIVASLESGMHIVGERRNHRGVFPGRRTEKLFDKM